MEDWQNKLIDQWESSSMSDLLDEVLYLAGGDDWDGHFTPHGWKVYKFMREYLKSRIAAKDKECE